MQKRIQPARKYSQRRNGVMVLGEIDTMAKEVEVIAMRSGIEVL
jgi:hypothetical protein